LRGAAESGIKRTVAKELHPERLILAESLAERSLSLLAKISTGKNIASPRQLDDWCVASTALAG
jgi:hypothetical protein